MDQISSALQAARDALKAARAYRQLWVEHGVDRVHLVYDIKKKPLD